jgi:hypothetical protein
MFRVAPNKHRKLTVPCVCLEYGKPDPTPRMNYQLVPLAQVNDSPAIEELCAQLGRKQVTQSVAQAAAWKLANGLSWEQLANINRVESQFTGNERFFNHAQLQHAAKLVSSYRQPTTAAPEPSYSVNSRSTTSAGMRREGR